MPIAGPQRLMSELRPNKKARRRRRAFCVSALIAAGLERPGRQTSRRLVVGRFPAVGRKPMDVFRSAFDPGCVKTGCFMRFFPH
jgi:hypothetical protein